MLVTLGEHRFNLLTATQLRKLSGLDKSLPSHLFGEICFTDGTALRLTQEQYDALGVMWDKHAEHVKFGDAAPPSTLPMPHGQSERDFNLGDE